MLYAPEPRGSWSRSHPTLAESGWNYGRSSQGQRQQGHVNVTAGQEEKKSPNSFDL